MSASYDIVAYTYNADLYCPDCIVGAIERGGMVVAFPLGGPHDTETILAHTARANNIDHKDESSYDSGDFPKVVFRDQIEPDDRCGACGRTLD